MAVVARQRTAGLRDAALSVGMGVAAVLAPGAAPAQDNKAPVQTAQLAAPAVKASYVKPPMDLEPHCNSIKAMFMYTEKHIAMMTGEPRAQIYAWIDGGCKGDVPVPDRRDVHNGKLFNTVAIVLQNSSRRIVLTP